MNMTVQTRSRLRKKQFRAALALAEMTQEEWADKQEVDSSHLSRVLSGERESATLCEKVDAFITKYFPESA